MKHKLMIAALAMALGSPLALAAPPDASGTDIQQQMQHMQELMNQAQGSKDQSKQRKLLHQHMQDMQSTMESMNEMMGGRQHMMQNMGGGMMGGGMQGSGMPSGGMPGSGMQGRVRGGNAGRGNAGRGNAGRGNAGRGNAGRGNAGRGNGGPSRRREYVAANDATTNEYDADDDAADAGASAAIRTDARR